MQNSLKTAGLAFVLACAACQPVTLPPPVVAEPQRLEARVNGPDRVFDTPVEQLVPALRGARASGPDGRVGSELVFWGYELENGQRATLVACAILPDVDCAARRAKVCESGAGSTLFSGEQGGAVRHRDCQAVGVAPPGEPLPNCTEVERTQPVELHLLSCQ